MSDMTDELMAIANELAPEVSKPKLGKTFFGNPEPIDYWAEYFMTALTGFVNSPDVSTWNENRLVEKAVSLANLALEARNAAEDRLN